MRVRAHLRLVAAIWLTCQAAAFAGAPFALCHDHGVMTDMGGGHECDPEQHHHGHPTPVPASPVHGHHQHAGEQPSSTSTDAAISCRCTVSDAALAALMLESGILTNEFVLDAKLVAALVVVRDYAAPTHPRHPDTPPPRA